MSGVECYISGNDPTVRGGAVNPYTMRKSMRGFEICLQNRLPHIELTESGGADLPRQSEIFLPGGASFRYLTQLSAAGIPTISLVFGNSTAGGAYTPAMCDYTVFVKQQRQGVPGRAAPGENGHRRRVERRGAGRRGNALPGVRACPTTWPPTNWTRCASAARSSPI